MLSRVALRAFPPTPSSHTHIHIRQSNAITALRIRTYADRPKRPPPPPPASSRPAARPPPPQNFQGASAQARQTSPGTSFPKDQTWRPKDGINFKTPSSTPPTAAASMPAAANAANRAEDAARMKTSIDGTRPQDPAVQAESPVESEAQRRQEPMAQKMDADEPAPGSVRDQVQDAQARAENMPPPPEPPVEEPTPGATGPLPDLRQGIPSTFDMEFGGQKRDQARQERPSEQSEGVDVTATPPEQRSREEREEGGEREYDRSAYETSLDRRRAQLANWLYVGILFSALSEAFYLARPFNMREEVPTSLAPEDVSGWSPAKMYARMRARLGSQVGYYTEPTFPKLLPEVPENQRQPFTLVLSLEDLMIKVDWSRENGYRVAKRPGIDYFIRYLSQYYELVLFTSAPLSMADPVIKKLDPYHFIMWPLGREATKYEGGEYIKDLSYLNRPLEKTLIIDTHAPHVKNQPENAIILPKWSGDPKDPHTKDLVALIPFLEYVATMGTQDVRPVLQSFSGSEIAPEFARREAEARKKFNESLAAEKTKRPKLSLGSLGGALGIKNSPAMGGGMVLADGQSVAEGLAQGKMLSDQIREQGQKQYEHIEKQIREHGAQWLKEEEEEQKKMMEAQMKDMKKGAFSWFGGLGGGKE